MGLKNMKDAHRMRPARHNAGAPLRAGRVPKVWTEPFTDLMYASLRAEAARKFRIHQLPSDVKTWEARRGKLVSMIWRKLGVELDHSLGLEYTETGVTRMEGYVVKNIYFRSRPGIYVTGNLYVPDGGKPFPAVVNMHGHWFQGRLAERVQERGHTLAKNGYVCLSVDAFGAGERSARHGEFEYHGGNLGASLMNIGETLMGAQIVDNIRAVDLLCSFDFVDKKRVGATGASGGGNQTMWLAALDERIAAAVPVVSVGTFESYVTRHNCICETLPDGLTFTEESGVLALAAPRALKICNCLKDDNPTFHVTEMLRSFNEARKVFAAAGAYDKFAYQAFNRPHGYWPEIREAMLGWFDLHLMGKGFGTPKQEKTFHSLPEEKIMVFKTGSRPAFVRGIADHCRARGRSLRKRLLSENIVDPAGKAAELKCMLRISGWLECAAAHEYPREGMWRKFALETTDGGMLPVVVAAAESRTRRFSILLHPSGKENVPDAVVDAALRRGEGVILADLCGTGETHVEPVPRCDILSRSLLWLGRSLLGVWAAQIELISRFAMSRLKATPSSIHAYREAGIAALLLNTVKKTNSEITVEEAPVSYLFNKTAPPDHFSMAIHLPGMLEWGDISLAAALCDARVDFVDPVLFDGGRINSRAARGWKKEFDAMAAKCGRNTNVTFRHARKQGR